MSAAPTDRANSGPPTRAELTALGHACQAADGFAPFGEATLLAAEHGSLAASWPRFAGGKLVAAAVSVADGSTELAVHPAHRRQGHGRALIEAVLAAAQPAPAPAFWAHGDLPGAQALAAWADLQVRRELLVMARPLPPASARPLPPGWAVRPFEPGQDEGAWLALNAAAFATHPEQGALTANDFEQRMGEAWFDPTGLLLLHPAGQPELAGFHWTKLPLPIGEVSADLTGEVYAIAIAPQHQGRGLAGPLLDAGLAVLTSRGATTVELYVEADNEAAVATYARAGFTVRERHRRYAR